MKDTLLAWAAVVALVISLAGCARYYWSKPGTTAEQFSGDSRDCVQQATSTLPRGSAVNADAFETLYRACLSARGFVRDKQFDPPPPGSYRGLEDTAEFAAAARTAANAPRQTFEQQLDQLEDLKARGRISEQEYAVMRRRLVEGATPSALGPAPRASVAMQQPSSQPGPPLPPGFAEFLGSWQGELSYRRSVLPGLVPVTREPANLRIYLEGAEIRWTMTRQSGQGREIRASGVVTGSDKEVTLSGRYDQNGPQTGTALEYVLTREGQTMSGTGTGPDRVVYSLTVARESVR